MLLLNFCNLLQMLYGKFLSILNKLTPQKFQKLAEQAKELAEKMNTQERMSGCVEKLFHKVSSLLSSLTHSMAIIYANLYHLVSHLAPPPSCMCSCLWCIWYIHTYITIICQLRACREAKRFGSSIRRFIHPNCDNHALFSA